MKTLGYLVSCEDRNLFLREKSDVEWAIDDENYKVTELVAKPEQVNKDETAERIEILEEIYELDEKEIKDLKARLENALELVEVIYEFTSREHESLLEARGTLKLVADSCAKWLKPSE